MNLEEKLIGSIAGDFVIEAYQRGYRWGKDEIGHLLNDIYESPDGQKYCLQPVVVKHNNGKYELIDGQQRMTTLYLIMKYLSGFVQIKYSIEYTTRKSGNGHMGSRELLENINNIDLSSTSSNIDELFIKEAFRIISIWFNDDIAKKLDFAQKLQKSVTIIWYEVDDNEDSVSIFTRLNIGKISLTNAELVKALFLTKGKKDNNGNYSGNPYGLEEKTQHEIALSWDSMEKELHDLKFWSFITKEDSAKYPIRMELLFDIIERKPQGESSFFTFNRFHERFKKSTNKTETWEAIVRYFQQLKEWYKDFDLYHQIGFLVATGEDVKALLDLSMNEENPIGKSAFKNCVIQKIRDKMVFKTADRTNPSEIDYADLNYVDHSAFIHTILLLFNVETIRQKGDENNRFPFERYKSEGTWSLEHIHAQNSESLRTNQDRKEWLDSHKKSLTNILMETSDIERAQQIINIIKEIDGVLSHINDQNYKDSIGCEFNKVSPDVIKALSNGDDSTFLHTLSNMALLTVGENAALNNSTFDVKREKILEMDKNGDFIPACTKNVFLKYYSPSDTKLHFWGEEDRKCYIQAMNDVLFHHKGSDNQEIKLIKSEIRYGSKQ